MRDIERVVMDDPTLNHCKQFLCATKKVLNNYPNLKSGLCDTIYKYNKHCYSTRIMYRLMHEHHAKFMKGISLPKHFSDHRLYFLLFITQLTPLELYDMTEVQ